METSSITQMPAITVVVPAHNEEDRIQLLLKALLKQTISPVAVIVVNNASTDDTKKLTIHWIQKFKKKGIRLTIIDQPKQGVAIARNTGFKVAKTPWIASTDADSQPDKDWIQAMVKHIREFPDSVAITGMIIMADAPWLIRKVTEWGWFQWMSDLCTLVVRFRPLHTANALFSTSAFMACGGFNESIVSPNQVDDFEIASRLAPLGPIRFEKRMQVQTSFRRYGSFQKAVHATMSRLQAWVQISRQFRTNRN